jgi:NhaP-type Na+/H+ or K+/H+ antiporter
MKSGMVIAFFGTPLVLKPETMHSVWSTIEWIGNTLLFLLAGVILGSIEYEITRTDVASVVIVYLLLQVIRVLKCLLLYPAVKDIGNIKHIVCVYEELF